MIIRVIALTFALLIPGLAAAQNPQPVPLYPPGHNNQGQPVRPPPIGSPEYLRQQEQYQGWNKEDRRPRWCRHYSRHDYYVERKECGNDRSCRYDARRKAERCGIRTN
jgi:hypothetical protein